MRGREVYNDIRKKSEDDKRQLAFIKSIQRRESVSIPVEPPNEIVSDEIKSSGTSEQMEDLKMKQIDEKLLALVDLEKRLRESEEKVRLEVRLAEEKVQAQLKLLDEKTKQVEAESKAREALMQLAVGPLSHRSPFSTNTNGSSHRFSQTPLNQTQPVTVEGEEWVKIWDNNHAAFYWWCEEKQMTQWEDPRDFVDKRSEDSDSVGGLTDYSTDADELNLDNPKENKVLGPWQEYWDEQAQAKYWYNNETVLF